MRKNIKHVFWLYFVLFTIMIIYLLKLSIFDSQELVVNAYNPRMKQIETGIERGKIMDRNNNILAETKTDRENLKREYAFPKQFSHIIGFTTNGMSGAEAKYNFELQKLDNEILQRANNIISKSGLKGNSIVLTLDKDIQNYVYEKLGNSKGAVVVMEPSTGKILSMVSYPNFNPETISEDWDNLLKDNENTPLLNRAAQGLYTPGSIFKVITAASAIENMSDWSQFTYTCKGEIQYGESRIRCFDLKSHGNVDMSKALSVSCNTFYSMLGIKLGAENLQSTAEDALFNMPLGYPLEYSVSTFSYNKGDDSEIMQTAIGQGRTMASPLHMAMIASAVGNKGIIMNPYIVDHIETYNGKIKKHTVPEKKAEIFSPETAFALTGMMESVVTSGTGLKAQLKGISIAGKTGTAENPSGDDHAWFIAFAPAENPKVAVAVLLENGGTGSKAVPIARDIIKYSLEVLE